MTEEDRQRAMTAMGEMIADLEHMLNGTDAHEGHTRTQRGRCCYCSCGTRAQGRGKANGAVR